MIKHILTILKILEYEEAYYIMSSFCSFDTSFDIFSSRERVEYTIKKNFCCGGYKVFKANNQLVGEFDEKSDSYFVNCCCCCSCPGCQKFNIKVDKKGHQIGV